MSQLFASGGQSIERPGLEGRNTSSEAALLDFSLGWRSRGEEAATLGGLFEAGVVPTSQGTHVFLYLFPQGERSPMAQLGAVVAVAASFFCASLFSAVHKIEEGHIGVQSCPTLCDPIDGSPPGSAALMLGKIEGRRRRG